MRRCGRTITQHVSNLRLVRDQAFKAIAMFLKRIEGMAAAMVSCDALEACGRLLTCSLTRS